MSEEFAKKILKEVYPNGIPKSTWLEQNPKPPTPPKQEIPKWIEKGGIPISPTTTITIGINPLSIGIKKDL